MDNTYAKFIAESAYKHTVDKPNTNKNLSFYEEAGKISHRVDLESIWVDSKYIPVEAPNSSLDENGIFYIEEHNIKIPILKKWTDVQLEKVRGTEATYSSVALLDAIFPSYGTGYTVTLKDYNDEEIPFGLNQWVVDPDNGNLSFLAGFPDGYQESPKVSFYQYIGRKAHEGLLKSDGSIPMEEGYVPSQDNDIVTKIYVDSKNEDLKDNVSKLIPTKPASLRKAKLNLIWKNNLMASPWNVEEKIPLVLYHRNKEGMILDDFKIDIPDFYNPQKGFFDIIVNDNIIFTQDISKIKIGSFPENPNGTWHITNIHDPYTLDIIANGFYTTIKSYVTLSINRVLSCISEKSPLLTIYVQARYDFDTFKSDPLTIGFDEAKDSSNIESGLLIKSHKMYNLENENNEPVIKYISGVPSLREGSQFRYDVNVSPISLFKNDTIGKFTVGKILDQPIPSKKVYPIPYSDHLVEEVIKIPKDVYTETTDISICIEDVSKSLSNTKERFYNMRIDTVSDESNRLISPSSLELPYLPDENEWTEEKAKIYLYQDKSKNELQLLNGLYRWPTGNYTQNGNFDKYKIRIDDKRIATNTIEMDNVPAGPDYSNIISPEFRYVTFKTEIPEGAYINGFWITIKNPIGIIYDPDTLANNIPKFLCKVVDGSDQTGWLDMNVPYEGVLAPTENFEGCLVVPSSTEDKKYITFGSTPRTGTICITMGLNKDSNIMFSGVDIVFNI